MPEPEKTSTSTVVAGKPVVPAAIPAVEYVDGSHKSYDELNKELDVTRAQRDKFATIVSQRDDEDKQVMIDQIIKNTTHWPDPIKKEELKGLEPADIMQMFAFVRRAPPAPSVDENPTVTKIATRYQSARIIPQLDTNAREPISQVKTFTLKGRGG